MRLFNNYGGCACVLFLTVGLAGCGVLGGKNAASTSSSDAGQFASAAPATGPAADYPMVLGEPFTVGGTEYTPADTWNYDEVGYAIADAGAEGVTVSHRTLPLPSYVEVTSLNSGKTILARVERRGPMTGQSLLALSPGAAKQLEASPNEPIRVRRVNPPETDRAALRADMPAPARIETPASLVAVLRRKLPEMGSVSLGQMAAAEIEAKVSARVPSVKEQPEMAAVVATRAASNTFSDAFENGGDRAPSYALPTLPASEKSQDRGSFGQNADPVALAQPTRSEVVQMASNTVPAENIAAPANDGAFVIQAAAFASEDNAKRAAAKMDGFIDPSGKFFRVRTGPYATRGQAEAALAKVRDAGYSDARVITTG